MKTLKTKKILKLDAPEGAKIVEETDAKARAKNRNLSVLAQASEIGFSIVIPISVGALLGVWLDEKFASHPKFTLSLLFGGIFIAFTNLFLVVREFSKKKTKG